MSTVFEIEQAIASLSEEDRIALENRLIVKRFGIDALSDEEHAELMESLDEAEREVEEGQTFTGDELREALRSWVGK